MVKHSFILSVLLAALAPGASAADKTMEVSFHFGATPALGQGGEQHSKAAWKMGAELAFNRGAGQWLVALDYRLFRPYEYETTLEGPGYTPDGQKGIITRYVLTGGLPTTHYKLDSADFRKNALEGFSLSLGYRRPLYAPLALSVQGGLSLNALQSQQILNTSIRVVDPAVRNANPVPGNAAPLYSEDLFIQVQQTKIRPGAWLGLRSQVNQVFFVECNLAWVGYASTQFMPLAYTGQPDRVDTANRTKAVTEICAGLRF